MSMYSILLVDDDVTFTKIVALFLKRYGYTIEVCHNVKDASTKLLHTTFSLLLLDYRLPDGTGLEVISIVQQLGKATPAIMMTSFNDVRTAVQAIQKGALNYITKPVNQEELLMLVQDALSTPAISIGTNTTNGKLSFVEGISAEATKLHKQVALVAPTDMSIIIYGESGTGKENIARQIHGQSHRAAKPFIAVDSGTLSSELALSELFGHKKGAFTGANEDKKGKFEEANGGTLFLDEIGNLNYDVQIKLLRALEERLAYPVGGNQVIEFDIRIIAATNENLKVAVQHGTFREDFYHRLNEFKIDVPPLRQRMDDLPLFVSYFIEQANKLLSRQVKGVSPEVMEVFQKYDWPGNIRELKNIIKRIVLLAHTETGEVDDLPEDMFIDLQSPPKSIGANLKLAQEQQEKEMIESVLREVKFNKLKAAQLLHINRSTLYAKMEKYGIEGK